MDAKLAHELREADVPPQLVPDLEQLAREIAALPDVTPDPAWLAESRERLLRRFDEAQEGRQASAPSEPVPLVG